MKRTLAIVSEPIDEARLMAARAASAEGGAIVRFVGIVRRIEGGASIRALDYEAFNAMAERQFEHLFDQMEKQWPVLSVHLVHRIGTVPVSEPSLWVEVVAPHRAEAFAACQWLIDEMKRVVPIWKRAVPSRA
jgi:molybdopterin synthase catalytic subunit